MSAEAIVDDFVVESTTDSSLGAVASPAPEAVGESASTDAAPEHEGQAPADLETPDTPDSSAPERNPDGTFKPRGKKDSLQARIDKAVWEREEAKRRAEAAERELETYRRQPPAAQQAETVAPSSDDKPKLEAFQTYEDWIEAVAEWKADQKLTARERAREAQQAQEREQSQRRAFAERERAFAAKTPEYVEAIGRAAHLPVSRAMQEAITSSEHGPALAYFLATHPEDAVQLAHETETLDVAAAPLVRRLLESKITAGAASSGPAPVVRPSVPAPIKPVGSAPVAVSDGPPPDDAPFEVHKAYYDAQERKARR